MRHAIRTIRRNTGAHDARLGRRWLWLSVVVVVLLAPACGMVSDVESASSDDRRTMVPGDRGASVAALQRDLRILGHEVSIDGVFDATTRAAVEAIQAEGELTVDGIVGPRTHQALADGLAAVDVTEVSIESMPDVDVVVHTRGDQHCFEILAGDGGASGCLVAGAPHATLRYVDVDLGPEVAPGTALLVGLTGPNAAGVTATTDAESTVAGQFELVPVVFDAVDGDAAGDATDAFLAVDPGAGTHQLVLTDASGGEVQRVALQSDPDVDLGVGAVGTAVLTWQRRFADSGTDMDVDGVFTTPMAEHIAAVQAFVGMEPTGVLDQPTRALLVTALEPPPEP